VPSSNKGIDTVAALNSGRKSWISLCF
jgi:hypothetical protein